MLAVEAFAEVDPSVSVLVDVQNTLVINAILRWGTDEVKRRTLPRLAASTVGAYALSEAGSGSDAFALTTRATADGDGFRLAGRKLWITNANEADLFIVFATVDPAAGYRGITAFLIERGAPGFTVGKKEDKLGIRASSTCELVFDACHVGRGAVLGEIGKGYKVAIETLNEGPDRHRRADARPRARCARSHDSLRRKNVSSSASQSRSSRPSSIRSRGWRPMSKRRAYSSTTPHACATSSVRS